MGLVPCVSNSASAATAAMMMMVMVTVKTISTLYGANHHDGRTARSILPPPSFSPRCIWPASGRESPQETERVRALAHVGAFPNFLVKGFLLALPGQLFFCGQLCYS